MCVNISQHRIYERSKKVRDFIKPKTNYVIENLVVFFQIFW